MDLILLLRGDLVCNLFYKRLNFAINNSPNKTVVIHIASSPYTASYDQGAKLIATNFRGNLIIIK